LVLGALFVREDPHDLPLIGSLAADETPTFVHVHATMNSFGFTGNLADIEDPQTVGQVAEAMLATYLRAAYVKDDCEFAEYWQAREGRRTCASWFLVRISRATRNTSPPQPEYQLDVQRVISELRALPPAERAWTQVFLRCTSFTDLEATLTDATCVAALKEIGPDEIVRFLERQRVTEDPDLWFDNLEIANSRVYSRMAHFHLTSRPRTAARPRCSGAFGVRRIPAEYELQDVAWHVAGLGRRCRRTDRPARPRGR
jgi:hypothetical protein